MKRLTILIAAFALALMPAKAETPFAIPEGFPRLVLDREDISVMKHNALSGEEPYAGAWKALQERLEVCFEKDWAPAVYDGEDSHAFYQSCIRSGDYARDLAIAYHISGDRKYAHKAVEIMDLWTSSEPLPGSWFDPEIRYPNTGMEVARSMFPFLYAYDLLRADDLVPQASIEKFENWLKVLLPHIKEGARRWEANDYFGKQYYQNHIAADAMGLMSWGIILGDEALVSYALDSEENPRDVKDVIEGLILMEGQKPYINEPVIVKTEDGEIMDRYRHFSLGGHYKDYKTKPNRGLQYCGLSSTLLVACAEMGRMIGVNLYGWTAETGECVKLPLLYYADFYILKDTVIKNGFYSGEDSWINSNDTTNYSLWEIAHCRYPDEHKFKDVLEANERGSKVLHLFGPVTLTHGR